MSDILFVITGIAVGFASLCLLAWALYALTVLFSLVFKASRRNKPMSAVDYGALSAEIDNIAANVQKVAAELANATATANQMTQLQAELSTANASLAQAQADLASSQSAVGDLTAKLKAADDALAAALPAPAPAA